MTNKASLLLAALLIAPAAALAQTAPQPPPLPGMPAGLPPMMEKMRAAHQALRTKILAALTPAHKALLAQVVGELAIADTPDRKAAVARLDAALSSTEKANIVGAMNAFMAQMPMRHREMHVEVTDGPPGTMPAPPAMPPGAAPMRELKHAPDAGEILLDMAGHGGMMGMMPMMPMRVEMYKRISKPAPAPTTTP